MFIVWALDQQSKQLNQLKIIIQKSISLLKGLINANYISLFSFIKKNISLVGGFEHMKPMLHKKDSVFY